MRTSSNSESASVHGDGRREVVLVPCRGVPVRQALDRVMVPIAGRLVEPAGQRIEVDGVDVMPCREGRVLGHETYVDGVSLLAQLGVDGANYAH